MLYPNRSRGSILTIKEFILPLKLNYTIPLKSSYYIIILTFIKIIIIGIISLPERLPEILTKNPLEFNLTTYWDLLFNIEFNNPLVSINIIYEHSTRVRVSSNINITLSINRYNLHLTLIIKI
jgi:hypothetical protein